MNTKRSTLACVSPLVSLVPTFHRLTSNYPESYTTVFSELVFLLFPSICVCFSKFQRNKLPAKVTFWQVLLQTLPIGLVFLSFTTFENGLTDNSVLISVFSFIVYPHMHVSTSGYASQGFTCIQHFIA